MNPMITGRLAIMPSQIMVTVHAAAPSKMSVSCSKYNLHWDHSCKVFTGLALVAVTGRLVAVLLAASEISKCYAAYATLESAVTVCCVRVCHARAGGKLHWQPSRSTEAVPVPT